MFLDGLVHPDSAIPCRVPLADSGRLVLDTLSFGGTTLPVPVKSELLDTHRMLFTLMSNLPGMAYRCRYDQDWTMEFVSEGAFTLTGYTSAELLASRTIAYAELIHPDDRDSVMQHVEAGVHAREPFRIVYRIRPAQGPEKWVWEQGCGVFSRDGELLALEGFIADITEAKRAEEVTRDLLIEQAARAAAETAERRAHFLSEASRVLATSFDCNTTFGALARLAVPVLADYCVVDMVSGSELVRLGAAHVDPAKEQLLLGVVHSTTRAAHGKDPLAIAVREGRPTLVTDISIEAARAALADEEDPRIEEQLLPRSLITVPLVVGSHVVGVLTLVMSESNRRFTIDDLALAEELARRAAVSVESAQLFHNAQQATQTRDHVLAIVAHDLRNPLGTVVMAADLVLETMADDFHRKHLAMIRRSADRMNQLIHDLLDVVRIEGGRLSIEPVPDRIELLIDEALATLRPLAAGRSIRLEGECEPGLPLVLFDNARIMQVVSNLVGNAIKFAAAGGCIRIRCQLPSNEVCISITDNGPGIPPTQLPHIFGGFWQASSTDRRGIGLGLSIAKGIVEAHGGRIWVESTVGVGSTFYFTLPARQANNHTHVLN
jgi:PAS domain S-box-containing protein